MTEENLMIAGTSVTVRDIFTMLPHRYPFLLVDRVVDMEGEERAVGIKNVTYAEPWFTGHFPEFPVFPGVLIVEAIAQTSAILVIHNSRQTGEPIDSDAVLFMAIDKARFRRPVVPGDQMRIHVEKVQRRGLIYRFKGKVYVEDEIAAEAEIMAMNYEPEQVGA